MVFGEGDFLSVICKDFLRFCGGLVLQCFLEASLFYIPIITTKEVQRLIMKESSINVCLFSCQFYYTHETCKHCRFSKKKKLCISILISLLKFIRNISKYHFSDEEVPLNLIMDIHCSTAEGGADQNRMAVDVRGGTVKIFHFAEVINKWPLNGRIVEIRVRIWSFWIAFCMYQSYLKLIIYRFRIHLLLWCTSYFCFCFGFSNIWENILTCIMWVIQEIYILSCGSCSVGPRVSHFGSWVPRPGSLF